MPGRGSCHRINFPVPGWRLRRRSGTSSLSTTSLLAVRPWDVNRRATPTNICCTAHGTRSFGQAGAYTSRRTRVAAPARFSKVAHCRTAIKGSQAVAESSALCALNDRYSRNTLTCHTRVSSTPQLRDSITDALEYWVTRSSRAMTACAGVVICPSGSFVSSPLCKNISVPTHPKSHLEFFASHPSRGAYRDRHGRGEGCGGRGSVLRATGSQGGLAKGLGAITKRADERCCSVRRSRVVLTPRRWRQVRGGCVGPTGLRQKHIRWATVAKEPGHRGEHE